jgi:hypothetical protein
MKLRIGIVACLLYSICTLVPDYHETAACTSALIYLSQSLAAQCAADPYQTFRQFGEDRHFVFAFEGHEIPDLHCLDDYFEAANQSPFDGCDEWRFYLIETVDAPYAEMHKEQTARNRREFDAYLIRFRKWQGSIGYVNHRDEETVR